VFDCRAGIVACESASALTRFGNSALIPSAVVFAQHVGDPADASAPPMS
jgi:hypothetical protein